MRRVLGNIIPDSNEKFNFPIVFLAITAIICIIPICLNMLGYDFSSLAHNFDIDNIANQGLAKSAILDQMFYTLNGGLQHGLLEWSAVMAAMLTLILALANFAINKDITTPIIGVALFCSGAMDAFHTLAALRLIDAVADNTNLIPFTWALSRAFNASIMIVGASICLSFNITTVSIGLRRIIAVSFIFGVISYLLIAYAAGSEQLPQTQFPNALIKRPYDVLPLVLFMMAIPVFWRLYLKNKNLLTAALVIALIPEIILEAHMAFGSSALFDNHFNISHFLKIIAYLVPFIGLVFDYIYTYKKQLKIKIQMEGRENFLQTVLDNTLDGIITINGEGNVETFNLACKTIFGYSSEEVIGQNIKMLMPEPYHSEHDGYLKNYQNTGVKKIIGSAGREVEGRRKDGTIFPLELSVSEIVVKGKILYSGLVRDITARKEAQERQNILMGRLTDSNEELERFAYICSHDLQEPLRMVRSYTQKLEMHYAGQELDEKAAKYMGYILDGAERAQNLISDILEYSRMDTESKKEMVDLEKVIKTATGNLSAVIEERNASITYDYLPEIIGNKVLLVQLLQNLISNGMKYCEKTPAIHVSAQKKNNCWLLSVQDNGIGIDPAYKDQIFVVFKRLHTRREYSGTGIGLSICKKIVEKHDGEIWVKSKLGEGSTFFISFLNQEEGEVSE